MSEITIQIQLLSNRNKVFCFKCNEPHYLNMVWAIPAIDADLWDTALVTVGTREIKHVLFVKKSEMPPSNTAGHLATAVRSLIEAIKETN